ncbi:MAG: FAD/NAD(P)-binding oxidoreductase [Candidatus Aenigmatarchaeota archaeon]
MRVIIVGGGIAGTSCAFFLRKFNKEAEIFLIDRESRKSYSPCALPYILSGDIERHGIFFFDDNHYRSLRIKWFPKTEVKAINTKERTVLLSGKKTLSYDYLVLATGSRAKIIENLLPLKTFEDYEGIAKNLKSRVKVSIVGAGFIGTETAACLAKKGHRVSLIEAEERVLKNYFDAQMSNLVQEHLLKIGIKLYLKSRIKEAGKNHLKVETERREISIGHDLAICCTGFEPETELAKKAGLRTGKGIVVDRKMRTSDPYIYACGDCVEYYDFLTKRKELTMLGSLAVRQAEVVAKNISGIGEEMKENINVFSSKVGEKFVGSAGLTKGQAAKIGIETFSAFYTGALYPEYYSDKKISYLLVSDAEGRILGAQVFSDENIYGILNCLSLAIEKGVKAKELASLTTPYHPLCSDIIDPLTICAGMLERKRAFHSERSSL